MTIEEVNEYLKSMNLIAISYEAFNALKKLYNCGIVPAGIEALAKLSQIELIVEAYKTDNPKEPYYDTEVYMDRIIEVVKNEQH